MDHPVGDVNRVRQRERRPRRHLVLRKGAADRHDLEDRARLKDVAHCVVARQVMRERRGVVVRRVARLLRHGEDRARVWVEHDRRRVLGMPLAHRLGEHLLGIRLDVAVECEEHVTAVAGGALLRRVHGLTERVAHHRGAPGRSRQLLVQLLLEPGEARIVGACVPEHRRRDRALRICTPLVGLEREAGQLELRQRSRALRRRLPLDVDEPAALVRERAVQGLDRNPEHLRRDLRLVPRVGDLHRVCNHVGRLLADRERRPQPVVDRPAPGGNHEVVLHLRLGQRGERRSADCLDPRGARAEGGEDEEDDQEQEAEPRVDDARRHAQGRPGARSR